MRIWAFPSVYPFDKPRMRWLGIFAHRQYKGLVNNGAKLKVIVPIPWYPLFPFSKLHKEWNEISSIGYPKHRVFEGIDVYNPRFSNIRPNRFVKKSYNERYIDAIIDFFSDNDIVLDPKTDIFFSQWLPTAGLVQQAAHKLGIKSAILCIGDDVMVYPQSKPESLESFKKTWLEADMRWVVADYLGKEANRIIGAVLPYDVVFYGVEYNHFKPGTADVIAETKSNYKIPADKTVILTIGSALVRKGWLDLFDALKEIKKTNNNFVQVAVYAGPQDFDLGEEAAKRGLTENLINIGEVRPELLSKLYNAADIFCLPSHWEGMANVVMESMSSGLPVLTTDVCGHPEVITHGKTGILIPPKRPDILGKELLELLNDKAKREYLGKNARNFMVNEWGDFTATNKHLYEKMAITVSL